MPDRGARASPVRAMELLSSDPPTLDQAGGTGTAGAAGASVPIVFISAHDDKEARARGLRDGAIAFLQKPFSEDSLLGAISESLDKS